MTENVTYVRERGIERKKEKSETKTQRKER